MGPFRDTNALDVVGGWVRGSVGPSAGRIRIAHDGGLVMGNAGYRVGEGARVLTGSHYLWSHEPCFYGWVEAQPPKLKPAASERTVWSINQQGEQAGVHPTQKPVELFIRPIEFHTRPGDLCYEPFSSSGTQIIAAERTGRICYAMEQGPRYCDVARARWESFSGQKALQEPVA